MEEGDWIELIPLVDSPEGEERRDRFEDDGDCSAGLSRELGLRGLAMMLFVALALGRVQFTNL